VGIIRVCIGLRCMGIFRDHSVVTGFLLRLILFNGSAISRFERGVLDHLDFYMISALKGF
jgi:hypothetical protein